MVKGLDGAGGILWSQNVGGAVQNRGPIINIGGTNVSFFTSQNGWVNALRATDGTSFWPAGVGQIGESVVAGVAYQPNVAVTGGPTSLIFAGTFTDTTLTNRMVALNAITGAEVWSFDNSANGGLGVIPTGPAVDWASNTLYFGTNDVSPVNGPGEGLIGAVGVWALDTTNGSVRWANTSIGNVVNSFPTVSRDGQTLYIGTINAGTFTLYALRTSDGTVRASFQAPGGVGDFRGSPWLWPNSANPAHTDIYATAGDRVYGFTDAGATGTLPFKSGWATGFATVPGAGTPLFLPTTNDVYVGGNNGTIYKINAGTGVITNQFFLGANAAVSDLTYDRVRDTFYLTTNGKLYSVIGNW
ncbi:MAG TPA: PQQ-binding-like beta-propeller repeat protein, partial [Chloroflexia bacterium]|nr:PQQ-binding-like beta-propeller repeat protein [Chloroflexia bacterium]